MAVRSKRLIAGANSSLAGTLAYTCPAGETALVKDLTIFNSGVASATVTLLLNGTANQNVIHRQAVPAGTTVSITERFIVMQPGDTLYVASAIAGSYLWAFGAELEGVAD